MSLTCPTLLCFGLCKGIEDARSNLAYAKLFAFCGCLIYLLSGCGDAVKSPVQLTPEQRQAIQQNLTQVGARATADEPDALYMSLRNTHVEIRSSGGVIDGLRRMSDVRDFCGVSIAIAKPFLSSDELPGFQERLQELLAANVASARLDYEQLAFTLTGAPLRLSFSVQQPRLDEQ